MPPPTITTSPPLVMREVLSCCECRRSCQSAPNKSTHRAGSPRIDKVLDRPAMEVVLCHARLRELLPAVVLSSPRSAAIFRWASPASATLAAYGWIEQTVFPSRTEAGRPQCPGVPFGAPTVSDIRPDGASP